MKKIIAEDEENSKEKILASAIKLFACKGFEGVSIREICKDAGVNICMISYYFGGKKELYQTIINELVERQTAYVKTFLDFEKSPSDMSKQEQIDLLMLFLDKMIDFFYNRVSSDLVTFLLKEQRNSDCKPVMPAFGYVRKLLACILDKNENDKNVILKMAFIISQINSPRILPAFSLRLLGQDEFTQKDIKIIKENVKMYVNAMLKEEKIV